jgi:two-component system, response regulator PdtaR
MRSLPPPHRVNGVERNGARQPAYATANTHHSYTDLRNARVLIIHPLDPAGESVVRAVRQLGCTAELVWPVPAVLPTEIDFALVTFDRALLSTVPWLSGTPVVPIIALTDATGISSEVIRLSNILAIAQKPCQPAVLHSNLVLARHLFGYDRRMQTRLAKLEETMHVARQIEQAKLIIMQQRKLRANEAYDFLRKQAMKKQVSIAAISSALVDAQEFME